MLSIIDKAIVEMFGSQWTCVGLFIAVHMC